MRLRSLFFGTLTVTGSWIGYPLCGPRITQLNISDSCNVDCIMCNRKSLGVSGFMPYERIVSLIGELHRLGTREIYFHGVGEPLMHPRIAEIFEFTARNYPSIKQFTVSNGTLLQDDLVRVMADCGVKVRVSLHAGDRSTWQKIHHADPPRLFDQAAEGIRQIARSNPELVELLFVIFKTNVGHIREMVEFAASSGAGRCLFRPMRLMDDAGGQNMNGRLMLEKGDYVQASRQLQSLREEYRDRLEFGIEPFETYIFDETLGRPSSREALRGQPCLIGFVMTVILTSGEVIGCLEESYDRAMGNINENRFREIWWSEAYQDFRRRQRSLARDGIDGSGCHTYCQHLGINRKMNAFTSLKPSAIWKNWRG